MSKSSYLFYDIESTGLNKAFDQVLQFAAIRTDEELNELERHEFIVKLRPDVIPSPMASITHHISISDTQNGLCEYEAITKIHQLLNKPGTISLGYNTLSFDDEFLRFSFYRNLLTPYTHQYANNCSRMDLYPMTVMYCLFDNKILNWPYVDNHLSLKLENLSLENNLASGPAHDAMVDVCATVALAKHLKTNQKMWQYLCGYFDKQQEIQRINKLAPSIVQSRNIHKSAILVNGKFGAKNNFQAPVLLLGQHKHYKNQTLWLRMDTPELRLATKDNFQEHCFVIQKKQAEPGFLLPMIDRFLAKMKPERLTEFKTNVNWLQGNTDVLSAIMQHYQHYTYPILDNVNIDAALYQIGFTSRHDQSICDQFHAANLKEKAKILERLHSPELQELGYRLLIRNYGKDFSNDDITIYNSGIDYLGNPKYSAKNALTDIETINKTKQLSDKQKQLITELEGHLASTMEENEHVI